MFIFLYPCLYFYFANLDGHRWGGMKRDIGTDIYTLPCIKWVTNENALQSTENSTQCSVMTKTERKSKKEGIYV